MHTPEEDVIGDDHLGEGPGTVHYDAEATVVGDDSAAFEETPTRHASGGGTAAGGCAPGEPLQLVIKGRAVYRIVKPLGQGHMGSVHLAQVIQQPADGSEPLPDQVAIKLMGSGDGLGEACHRVEIGSLRAVDHPNVVRLHDWRFTSSLNFIVLDYHEAGSLLDQMNREGPVSVGTALHILRDLLSALVETHGRGLLHLDIKPANVLVDSNGHFLLTDFGIAHALFQSDSRTIMGTPAFMSPEQARGENDDLDARSDLYSLGATMWQAITADFSIQRRAAREVLFDRKTTTLPALAPRVPGEYASLARIVDELLQFDRHDRPGTAAEVLRRVERLQVVGACGEEDLEASLRGSPLSTELREKLRNRIVDAVLRDLFQKEGEYCAVRLYRDGEVICEEEECSYVVYVLLVGSVEVMRHGKQLSVERREGQILGEVSALVGKPRTATLRARGETVLAHLKGAELEQAARRMPALAVRIMKSLAARLVERDSQTPRP